MTQQEKQLKHYISVMEGSLRSGTEDDFKQFEAYVEKVQHEINFDTLSWPVLKEYRHLLHRFNQAVLPQN